MTSTGPRVARLHQRPAGTRRSRTGRCRTSCSTAAAQRADRPALIDGPSGRTLTYRELADGSAGWPPGWPAAGWARATCSP